ncbi:hypothetical protein JCM6882_007375 [Rhodosporidiobolus microsporus]
MDNLPAQISAAITLALNPSPSVPQEQRHQAYTFLQQVKDAASQTWDACWKLFLDGRDEGVVGGRGLGAEERMFAVQVVGEALPTLSPEALTALQSSLVSYFRLEYLSGPCENGTTFLKNATVHLLASLFVYTYPSLAPSLFSDFLALAREHPPTSPLAGSPTPTFNPATTDLLLRLLHEISLEISDAHLRLNKTPQRLTKDTELRDAVRERDATAIAGAVWEIIGQALEGAVVEAGAEGELKGQKAREVAEMAVKVAGDYVSWIDINLMVTPQTIGLLLRAINLPSSPSLPTTPIRSATADTLIETVSKGMPAADKLRLFEVLDVGTVLAGLVDVGREGGRTEAQDEATEGFREKLAKLLNVVGGELCKIIEDNSTAPDAKLAASTSLTPLLPLTLRFLADPSPHSTLISLAPVPFLTTLLSIYKKEKKRAGAGAGMDDPTMSETKRAFLTELLKVGIEKMRYGEEVEWEMSLEGEEEEEQVAFAEMRKNLRVLTDGIAWIDPSLYADAVQTIIGETFAAYAANPQGVSWQRVELALAMLYGFGQAISAAGPGSFVVVPAPEVQRAKRETDYRIDYKQYPLSPLGAMMLRACDSKVVEHPHPAVGLQMFEVAVRYCDFFKICPEFITVLLPSFLDQHGLHQPDSAVQARVFYLFNRFIYNAKAIVQANVSGELVSTILTGMQDLLVITAALPDSDPPSLDLLTKAASTPSFFDAQLYLFETVGTLISILNQVPDQQVVLLNAVLDPLLKDLQANVRPAAASEADFNAVLKAHHLIMAAASVAKGFPDLSARVPTAQGAWVEVFKAATEAILASAKIMGSFVVIRDAARFAFNRIVATTGQAVLPLIPTFIDCLVGEITFPELADLLSFLGLLVAKYKIAFLDMLDTLLLPVFNRVFHFLQLPIAGTDDMVQHSTLRRAYFNFILSICGAGLQEVFYSEKNKAHLQSILTSIIHYISTDSLAPDQRYGFGVLNKLVLLWVEPYRVPTAPPLNPPPQPSPVPGFEQFLYQNAVKVCFEVPMRAEFDYSDAQSVSVIGEIALLLKTLLQKRAQEFVEFMTAQFFPSIACPPEASAQFMTALQEAPDGKQFKKFLIEWLRTSRGGGR